MLEAIVALAGVFGGVVLGWWLNELSTRRREEQAEKRQDQNVRTIVSLEIDRNLALLSEFWTKLKEVDPSDSTPVQRPL